MSTKKIPLKPGHIATLPNDKPVLYKASSASDANLYVGVAKRGRVHGRLEEHLPRAKDPIPGATHVQVKQMPSIAEAKKAEARIIAATQPKHNIQHKKK